jgi:hypothetical protein
LIFQQSYPNSSASVGGESAQISELVAIPLSALPKAIVSVVAPPWDGPGWYGGAALVDLRDPLPGDIDLTTTLTSLAAARDAALIDAGTRLNSNPGHIAISRVGVLRWDDDSLGCPGVTATSHPPVTGYVLFMVGAGIPVSRELEYHIAGDHAVFCGYSH